MGHLDRFFSLSPLFFFFLSRLASVAATLRSLREQCHRVSGKHAEETRVAIVSADASLQKGVDCARRARGVYAGA